MTNIGEFESYIDHYHPFKKAQVQSNIKNEIDYDQDLNSLTNSFYNSGNVKDNVLFKRLKKNKMQYEDKLNSSNEQIIARNHVMLPKYGKYQNFVTINAENNILLQNNYINQGYYPIDVAPKKKVKNNASIEMHNSDRIKKSALVKTKKNPLFIDPKSTDYEPMELIYLPQKTPTNDKSGNFPLIVLKPKENVKIEPKNIKQINCPNRSFDQCVHFLTKKPPRRSKVSPYAYIHKNTKDNSPSPSKINIF